MYSVRARRFPGFYHQEHMLHLVLFYDQWGGVEPGGGTGKAELIQSRQRGRLAPLPATSSG